MSNPLTLGSGTSFTFYDPAQTLNFAFTAAAGYIYRGYAIPFAFASAGSLSVPSYATAQGGWLATAEIRDAAGDLLFSPGQRVNRSLPAGTRFAAGTVLPSSSSTSVSGSFRYAIGTVIPAGTSLGEIVLNGEIIALEGQVLPSGAVIPAGSNLVGTSSTRPVGPDGTQGKIYAIAAMLAPGSQSWSMRLAAGADLASADSRSLRSLRSQASLASAGNLTLDDKHFSGPGGSNEALSVIRTGTGDLELLAGGNYRQNSLFGVYTAGTQSAGVGAEFQTPINLQPDGTVLGAAYSDPNDPANYYAPTLDGYQAWFPEHGGDLTITAQGNLTGYTLNGDTDKASNPANWLWRQGGQAIGQQAAWWINFGSYTSVQPSFYEPGQPTLIGFSGFGALAGGNVRVSAGGDAGVIARGADYGRQLSGIDIAVGGSGRVLADGTLVQTGGGTVDFRVAGALNPGGAAAATGAVTAYLDGVLTNLRGDIDVTARSIGSLTVNYGLANRDDPRPIGDSPDAVSVRGAPYVSLGDGVATLRTRGDLALGTVIDAVRAPGNTTLATAADGTAGNAQSWFTLWTDRSAIDLFSLGGDLTPNVLGAPINIDTRALYYPGKLRMVAAGGNIYGRSDLPRPLELAPSASAEFEMLASGSLYMSGGFSFAPLIFAISGADPASMATPFRPAFTLYQQGTAGTDPSERPGGNDYDTEGNTGELFRFGPDDATGTLHRGSDAVARMYAVNGDIVNLLFGYTYILDPYAYATGGPSDLQYVGGLPASIRAGRDIVALGSPIPICNGSTGDGKYRADLILHSDPTDVSVISAGRDIFYANVSIMGPGNLDVTAGRNIYQGGRGTFHSLGPVEAEASSAGRAGGASISLTAGVGAAGPDYADFARRYLDPANLADPARPLADQAGKVAKVYDAELSTWLGDRYGWTGTAAQALPYFEALAPEQQAIFVRSVYFEELRQSGREYNDTDGRRFGSYLRGRDAIATLFPGKDASGKPITYDGEITMFGERAVPYYFSGVIGDSTAIGEFGRPRDLDGAVLTDFGGDVQLLTPGGALTVGVEGVQPTGTSGLLTQGSGNIEVFAKDSILLGLSRAFTTFGGGITMWSAEGDINAGRGAKTTIVYAPVRRVYDDVGNVSLSPTAPTSGAGIGTLNPIPEVPAGDIDLIAPLGTIDAGEAGIRVSGDVNLAALHIVNAANIQVQGDATGIPVAAAVNIGALTAASAANGAVSNEAARLAERAHPQPLREMPTILNVRFIGFGPAE